MSTDLAMSAKSVPSANTVKELAPLSRAFLTNLKLVQGVSQENDGKFLTPDKKEVSNTAGDFILTTDKVNLGRKVNILVLDWRSHALLLKDNKKEAESFNEKSEIYRRIITTDDDKTKKIVVMHGIELLIYIPATMDFCTFFPSKKSFRHVTHDILNYMRKPEDREGSQKDLPYTAYFELISQFTTKGNARFFVPNVLPLECTADLIPSERLMTEAVKTFLAPCKDEPTVTNEETTY